MNSSTPQRDEGEAAGQSSTAIVDQQDVTVIERQASLRRRRTRWRVAQASLRQSAQSISNMPVHERLALARVSLINSLLARAQQEPENLDSDAASAALASRVDITGRLRHNIDNATPRIVQDPMLARPYRYIPHVDHPEDARALQRARVGLIRNTRASEPQEILVENLTQAVENDINNFYNGQDIDLDDIDLEDIVFEDDTDNNDFDPAADFLDVLDFCPELGDGPADPDDGFNLSPALSYYVPVNSEPQDETAGVKYRRPGDIRDQGKVGSTSNTSQIETRIGLRS